MVLKKMVWVESEKEVVKKNESIARTTEGKILTQIKCVYKGVQVVSKGSVKLDIFQTSNKPRSENSMTKKNELLLLIDEITQSGMLR